MESVFTLMLVDCCCASIEIKEEHSFCEMVFHYQLLNNINYSLHQVPSSIVISGRLPLDGSRQDFLITGFRSMVIQF